MKNKKLLSFVSMLLAFVMVLSIVGCSKPEEAETKPAESKSAEEQKSQKPKEEEQSQDPVIIIQGVDAVTLDPQFSGSLVEANMFEHLFSKLVKHDRNVNIVADLATDWEVINDNYTWRFYLRDDAVFHDGSKFTAEDVKYTIERALDPKNKISGNTAWLTNNMNIDKVEVVDDYTVDITTKKPHPILTTFMSEFYILSKSATEGKPKEEIAMNPVGTGAYRFVEWKKGDRVLMEINKDYFGDIPKIEKLVWRAVPEAATRIAELGTGGADIIVNVLPDMTEDLKDNCRLEYIAGGRRIFVGFSFYGNPELKDKRVRQAFNYAVDFDTIIDSLLSGRGERSGINVNPPWDNLNVKPYPYDLEKAKELMNEAGWKDTDGDGFMDKNGEKFTIDFLSPNGRYIKDLEISQAIGAYLLELGIDVKMKPQEWSTYTGLLHEHNVKDIYLIGSGSTFEGQGDLADVQKDSSSNYGDYHNPEWEKRWDQLISEFDSAERHRLMNEMQEIMHDDPPYIFLYMQVDLYGVSNRLDWEPYKDERIRLTEAAIVE